MKSKNASDIWPNHCNNLTTIVSEPWEPMVFFFVHVDSYDCRRPSDCLHNINYILRFYSCLATFILMEISTLDTTKCASIITTNWNSVYTGCFMIGLIHLRKIFLQSKYWGKSTDHLPLSSVALYHYLKTLFYYQTEIEMINTLLTTCVKIYIDDSESTGSVVHNLSKNFGSGVIDKKTKIHFKILNLAKSL